LQLAKAATTFAVARIAASICFFELRLANHKNHVTTKEALNHPYIFFVYQQIPALLF